MKKKPSESKSQIERFREMARELGADESDEAFKVKLRAIARQNPSQTHAGDSSIMAAWDETATRDAFRQRYLRLDDERARLLREAQRDPSRQRWHDAVSAKAAIYQLIYQSDCLSSSEALSRRLSEISDPDEHEEDASKWFDRAWRAELRAVKREYCR